MALFEHFRKGETTLADLVYCADEARAFEVVEMERVFKRGSVRTNWKERVLLLLRPGVLVYVADEDAANRLRALSGRVANGAASDDARRACEEAARLAKGTCRLTKDSAVNVMGFFEDRSHVLTVKAPPPSQRIFFFSAPSSDRAARWRAVLEDRQAELGGPGERLGAAVAARAAGRGAAAGGGRQRAETAWVLGQTEAITDFYRLGRQLGQPGQFGRAVEATRVAPPPDESLVPRGADPPPVGARVAVKIIGKSRFFATRSASRVERAFAAFRQEVEIMERLRHDNIVRCYETYEDRTSFYIVMELCPGGELFDRISRRGRLTERDAAAVLRQVLDAVRYMHSEKVAHCDLKPDNFIFDSAADDATLKVIDFGMSKHVRVREYFTRFCGTPYYVAPEVISGKYDEACDLWSIGVIAFVMLFGFPPFFADPRTEGKKADQTIYRRIRRGFDPTVRDGYGAFFPKATPVSEAARDLIGRLLEKDTRKRLTAAEALEHRWLNGQAPDEPLSETVINSLRQFNACGRFKAAVLDFMTSALSDAEVDELEASFHAIDTNGDGVLSLDELRRAFGKFNDPVHEAEMRRVLEAADQDGNGVLSYEELRAVYVQRKLVLKEERMWDSFCRIDSDHNGWITADELSAVLGDATLEECRQLIGEADKNGDGRVDYNEFLALWAKANPGAARDVGDVGELEEEEEEEDDDE